jgi:NAD(P)H-hydrate epimerase
VDSFQTEAGLVVPAVTSEQMREVDRVAIEEVGPNLYQMMENAGRNLASMCVEMLGQAWARSPVVVLAGTGGNGGGGICAARHLANHGGQVTLVTTMPSGSPSISMRAS